MSFAFTRMRQPVIPYSIAQPAVRSMYIVIYWDCFVVSQLFYNLLHNLHTKKKFSEGHNFKKLLFLDVFIKLSEMFTTNLETRNDTSISSAITTKIINKSILYTLEHMVRTIVTNKNLWNPKLEKIRVTIHLRGYLAILRDMKFELADELF